MKNLNLSQIIEANEEPSKAISFETLQPYLRSLYTYYKDLFCCEPVLMVTDVFNACQYAKIVSSNDFNEAISEYLETIEDLNQEDRESQEETINFNSQLLKDLI
jgi:hypothetical protein